TPPATATASGFSPAAPAAQDPAPPPSRVRRRRRVGRSCLQAPRKDRRPSPPAAPPAAKPVTPRRRPAPKAGRRRTQVSRRHACRPDTAPTRSATATLLPALPSLGSVSG